MQEFIESFRNSEQLDDDMRIFNNVHIICVIGMLIMSFVVRLFIADNRAVYMTACICVLFLLTFVEGNRTGNKKIHIIIMSIIFNMVYMPAIYLLFGRNICAIPLYFVFGIIYSILLLDIKSGLIVSAIESILYVCVLVYSYINFPISTQNLTERELWIRYGATMVAIVIAGATSGAAVRFRYLYYEKERNKSERLKAEALEAYVTKDIFLINMSHEIRTPMNAIVGAVNLLLDREVDEHISDNVYNILNSCNALLAITDELMDLSQSESGDIELYLYTYDLSEFLMEIINMTTVRLTESNLEFYVDINKNIPRSLYGDSSKLRQVFVNILNNAIKFTQSGKIILRVDYKPMDENSVELIVDVEDTGEGIRKEDIGNVFNRYMTKDDSQNASTGLGLSVCKDIVDKMNGNISVKSEYKVGSVFTFKVPQKNSSNTPIAAIDSEDYYVLIFEKNESYAEYAYRIFESLEVKFDVAKSRSDLERLMSVNRYTHVLLANEHSDLCNEFLNNRLNSERIVALIDFNDNVNINKATALINRPMNIINVLSLLKNENNSYVRDIMKKGGFVCPHVVFLVVDDNTTNLNVASSILKKYDATVLTAISGKDCLRVLRESDVDMIFLDYMMPEMNGIDTLENIRKIPGSKYSAMPVVALTANVVSGAKEMFLEAGFDDFLAKPIDIDKMERIIRKYLPKELIVQKNKDI